MTFLEQVLSQLPADDCVLWPGCLGRGGYGKALQAGVVAHRVVYKAVLGDIPDGLQLDHLCRVRRCVNPAHLEPVSAHENTRRGLQARFDYDPLLACRNGHPRNEKNIRVAADGSLDCRPCNTAAQLRVKARKQAAG